MRVAGGVIWGVYTARKWIQATAHAKCLRRIVDIGDGLKHNFGVLPKEGTPSHTPQIHHGPHSNVTLNFWEHSWWRSASGEKAAWFDVHMYGVLGELRGVS